MINQKTSEHILNNSPKHVHIKIVPIANFFEKRINKKLQ